MSTQRPALADVLARVTTCDDAVWWRMMLTDSPTRIADTGIEWKMGPSIPWARLRGWAHPTPADALGALVEAALLPEHWADEGRAPRWWCEGCSACGPNPRVPDGRGYVERETCFACDERGYNTPAPPSHAALVAVVSRGREVLFVAEAIVAEAWPGRALVWRVMTAEEVREHHERCKLYSGGAATALEAFSREQVAAHYFGPDLGGFGGDCKPPWPAEPFTADSAEVHRAWIALRALAALGLHLVALDAGRVVIAVEALA